MPNFKFTLTMKIAESENINIAHIKNKQTNEPHS